MRMLEAFFSINTFPNGTRIELSQTYSLFYFQKGLIYLEGDEIRKVIPTPLISQHQDLITPALGQFPVIYLDFAPVGLSSVADSFKYIVREAFKQFSHVINDMKNTNISAALRDRISKCEESAKNTSENVITEDLLTAIQTLSEFLHAYYAKKVIILIDEYDVFAQKLYLNLYHDFNPTEESSIVDFYKKFSQYSFLSNNFLEKAIITSVHPVAETLGLSGANEVRRYNFIDGDDLYTFFAFTASEVLGMLDFHDIQNVTNDVARWYGGYNFPNSVVGHLFSPISVTGFIAQKNFSQYVAKSISVEFIFKLRTYPVFLDALKLLVNNGTYDVEYSKVQNLNVQDLRSINTFVKKPQTVTDFKKEHCDVALVLLCGTSYGTVDKTFANNGKNDTHIRIKLPNEEIRANVQRRIDSAT